jgi:hypothetical protein
LKVQRIALVGYRNCLGNKLVRNLLFLEDGLKISLPCNTALCRSVEEKGKEIDFGGNLEFIVSLGEGRRG